MVIKGLCLAGPLIVIGMAAHAAPEASTNTGRITPRPSQTFRGWGMSLAWEAQDLYGGQRQIARITDPALQSQYCPCCRVA